MNEKVILVPVDGASNIKLEALDFETLAALHSQVADSPTAEFEGLACNDTGKELDWFDAAIQALPASLRTAAVVAPVARGCSGGLIGADDTLIEAPGRLTLAYTHRYPDDVEERFRELAGSEQDFYLETGSIRDFPGGLTLLKRFVFEEMKRPELVQRAAGFAYYGALMAGHFLGDRYGDVQARAGNEHSYWMCHTGTRDIRREPGTPSHAASRVAAFRKLVPAQPAVVYRPLGAMPKAQAEELGLAACPRVVPGGHDSCLSHIPILSTFYQAFPERTGKPVIHVEAGTWTVIAQVGGSVRLPADGYARDILVQGTVDGEPVATARYGGGADFAHLKKLAAARGCPFDGTRNEQALRAMLERGDGFVLPNICPANVGTGPFPAVEGRIIGEDAFFANGAAACILTNLMTAITTTHQVEAFAPAPDVPLVLTAGGSRDAYFGPLLAALTGRPVYAMQDRNGEAVTETTTLGAAIAGKAACLGVHPYEVDMGGLGVRYLEVEPLPAALAESVRAYRGAWGQTLKSN